MDHDVCQFSFIFGQRKLGMLGVVEFVSGDLILVVNVVLVLIQSHILRLLHHFALLLRKLLSSTRQISLHGLGCNSQ